MKNKLARLYVITTDEFLADSNAHPGPWKIGVAIDTERRLKDLQTGSAKTLCVVWQSFEIEEPIAKSAEKFLHAVLDRFQVNGEWFCCDPKTFWSCIGGVKKTLQHAVVY
jgi:Meiotically up-regulated gene 113